jgi:hypothetical protein
MAGNLESDHWLETYKSLIALASEGFKFSALINGGAAVALVAYLGNLSANAKAIPDVRCAMLAFLVGLSLCGFSLLFAYLTQLARLNDLSNRRDPTPSWQLPVAITLFTFSLIAFVTGAWLAVTSFT